MSDDLDAKEFGERLDMARDEMEELEKWDARKPEVQAKILEAILDDYQNVPGIKDNMSLYIYIGVVIGQLQDGKDALTIEEKSE